MTARTPGAMQVARDQALKLIWDERIRQRDQWGNAHDDSHPLFMWGALLMKWAGRTTEVWLNGGPLWWTVLERHCVKVAAVAVAAVEAIDRKQPWPLRTDPDMHSANVVDLVSKERDRQDAMFGKVRRMSWPEWFCVLGEEIGEADREAHEVHSGRAGEPIDEYEGTMRFRTAAIQVAAVACNMVEHLLRGDTADGTNTSDIIHAEIIDDDD